MNQEYIGRSLENDEKINLRQELEKYLTYWKWFVLGGIMSVGIAYLYLRYTPAQYNAETSILIDDKKSGISPELAAFEDLGALSGAKNIIDNEIEKLKSRKIVGEAIKRLDLTISYFKQSRVKETEIYKESPIRIKYHENDSTYLKLNAKYIITSISNTQFELETEDGEITVYDFNKEITNKYGTFKVVYKPSIDEEYVKLRVFIKISDYDGLIDKYRGKIKIEPANRLSSVLNLNFNSFVNQKSVDFLDKLIQVYNEDAIFDKNQVSLKTYNFIEERLLIIGKSKDSINNNLKDFKTKNKLTDITAEAQLVLETLSENNEKIIHASIGLKLVQSLHKDLKNQKEDNKLLATNIGLEDPSIALAIAEFNRLILSRISLSRTASDKNPQMIKLNQAIEGLRSSLLQSLNNSEKKLQFTLEQLQRQDSKIRAKISGVPVQELEYQDIRLQQEITAGLYSYLLKKKEETSIAMAVAVPNAKIIDKAYGNGSPVSPNKRMIYLVSLLLGFMIPFSLVYLVNLLDTKIHNKEDLIGSLSLPFLGDVPQSEGKLKIVIGADARSSTAEAFRLIRTNLDFMLANIKGKSKTIFITSTTSGEGKSFISINVAASLALSGKKVLLMGMDLRAPKVTEYLGVPDRKGVTNYITDDDLDLENLIFNIDDVKNLDIISSGVVPPNPAELLMTKRTENLFTIVKEEYDFIIVDTAPVNLVTDTLLIAKYADMFMYVARANYLDKRLLEVPQNLYKEKRLPNMAMVLNATDPKRSYGYGYGGYGYGYVVVEKPWYKKIFDRS